MKHLSTRAVRYRPGATDLLVIFALAVAMRVVLYLVVAWVDEVSFNRFVEYIDGRHYLAYARAWLGADNALDSYNQRLFPGYPGLMALLHILGAPLHAAAVLPNWLAAGGIAVFSAALFSDRRIGYAMAVLTPSFLINSVLISAEPWCLLLGLAGLWLARRNAVVAAGMAFGLAGMMRPMACLILAGYVAMTIRRGRWTQGLLCAAVAAAVVIGGMGLVALRFGTPFMSFVGYSHEKAYGDEHYGGRILTWPFESLVMTPARQRREHEQTPDGKIKPVPTWKIAFIWIHVVPVVIGCGIAAVRWRLARSRRDILLAVTAAVWLGANTMFVVCIGSRWGFHSFDRFILIGLPPLLFSYQRLLPARLWMWLPIAVLSLAVAAHGTANGSIVRKAKQSISSTAHHRAMADEAFICNLIGSESECLSNPTGKLGLASDSWRDAFGAEHRWVPSLDRGTRHSAARYSLATALATAYIDSHRPDCDDDILLRRGVRAA